MSTIEAIRNTPYTDSLPQEAPEAVNKKQLKEKLSVWKPYQRFLFRIAFIFFIILSIPNSWGWYKLVAHIDWTSLHYRDLYDIARFNSGITWFGNKIFGNSLLGYAVWINTLLFSIAAALVWTFTAKALKKERQEYNTAYYWLRAIVRYRAAIGIIGFGFTKLLPVQMPYPSLGVLNTDFGDLTSQKIYWLSIGIVPWYQVFAGVVELTAGTLLFFRRTTTLGAILLFGALGDIVYVNFAYDGGVHGYSSYFVLLAGFLLINDLPKIYNLFILERFTVPVNFYPAFPKWLRLTRATLKSATILIFLGVLFYLQFINWRYDPYKQPSVAGVKTLRGNYTVSEFRINNKVIPYSPLDTVRWNEATFENWTTLTFRVNKPNPLDLSNGGGSPQRDLYRTFELTGVGGGQRVFHYYADEQNKTLYLQDKYKARRGGGEDGDYTGDPDPSSNNESADKGKGKRNRDKTKIEKEEDNWIPKDALANIGNEVYKIDKNAISTRRKRELKNVRNDENRNRMVLKYDTQDGSRIFLSGINENKDSIYVVLDRINRNYALTESSLQAGKY
ncbi:MFS transporter [Pinibacter aurantiacus]|uniref:DoxX family protein n=1 Tax=Pinibacter aurantiacus TaxID=2851599 RepID=A0A9E2W7A8_9BACT|nr:hypothetical protein [Pinibacter aurantiacus]MBV4355922.1 hypothetical protein [Pinibacter aurantiacus]